MSTDLCDNRCLLLIYKCLSVTVLLLEAIFLSYKRFFPFDQDVMRLLCYMTLNGVYFDREVEF